MRADTPPFSTTRATTSSSLSSGSATRADLIARIISHTSGPPARAARRPVGPSRNTTPGCSAVRSPSSTSRLAAGVDELPRQQAVPASELEDETLAFPHGLEELEDPRRAGIGVEAEAPVVHEREIGAVVGVAGKDHSTMVAPSPR